MKVTKCFSDFFRSGVARWRCSDWNTSDRNTSDRSRLRQNLTVLCTPYNHRTHWIYLEYSMSPSSRKTTTQPCRDIASRRTTVVNSSFTPQVKTRKSRVSFPNAGCHKLLRQATASKQLRYSDSYRNSVPWEGCHLLVQHPLQSLRGSKDYMRIDCDVVMTQTSVSTNDQRRSECFVSTLAWTATKAVYSLPTRATTELQ